MVNFLGARNSMQRNKIGSEIINHISSSSIVSITIPLQVPKVDEAKDSIAKVKSTGMNYGFRKRRCRKHLAITSTSLRSHFTILFI